MTGHAIALTARRLVGTRFRLHGRDPATGLDCVGLVAAALGTPAPCDYGLRNRDISGPLAFAQSIGLQNATGPIMPGDVVLIRTGPAQHHLLIAGLGGTWVHAHAGLRRVVETAASLPAPIERHWRMKD